MKVHNFSDEDLRLVAAAAIDLFTEHLFFKVIRSYDVKDNYWSIECRFTHDESRFDTYYDSLHINSGNANTPFTYQMQWNIMKDGKFKVRPITNPLFVVYLFNQMCENETATMN